MMKKKALIQDFKVEIKKSINRFASILLIVALGVAFFSGIRSSEPDMRLSADRFYDNLNLMDIRVLSTLGLTDEDVEAIRRIDGIQDVEPSYSIDVLCDSDDTELVVKIISQTKKINQINIVAGRLPENSSECLVDQQLLDRTDYKIGDKIQFRSGTSEDISKSLKKNEYKIVGSGTTANYLSLERGSSAIGNGKLNSFIIVPPEFFNLDAYTEIFATVKGAKELTAYTEEYDNTIETVLDRLESIADTRREARYQAILEEPQSDIKKAKEELSEKEAETKKKLDDALIKLNDAKMELKDGEEQLKNGKEEISNGKAELEENKNKLIASEAELKEGKETISTSETLIQNGSTLLEEKQTEYQNGVNSLAAGYKQWNTSKEEWDTGKATFDENDKKISAALEEVQKQKERLEPVQNLYKSEWQKVLATEKDLLTKEEELNATRTELEKTGLELDTAKQNLDKKQVKLNAAGIRLKKEKEKLEDSKTTIIEKKSDIQTAERKIADGWEKIKKAEADIKENEKLLSEKGTELATAKETINEKESEYLDGVNTAKAKIEEGKKKIADAEEKINKIEYPKWYVLDRNSIQTYVEYGQDSERIGNIGKVFPVIFFLVAALVSLTTMTRMVEEERTQIGTYKALGYKKSSIAGKYILYGFFASIIGSILGVVIGEKFLPYVIITAYGILYKNLPEVVTPINLYYGILSTLIAVLCTTLASLFACYKELMAPPSELMRPASPKLGKRVLLERVSWIWKNLNFTQKSTVRNLMRYKKRFFMTIFGIGGCMALLLVGFGLKDSISAMSDIQYVDLWHHDSSITVDDKATVEEKTELFNALKADSRIADFISVKETTEDVGFGKVSKNVNMVVPENSEQFRTYLTFRDRHTHESMELSDNGVVITEKLASLLGVNIGDTIYIKDSEISRTEIKVAGIVENYMMHYIFLSPTVYEELYKVKPVFNKIYTINADTIKGSEEELAADMLGLDCVKQISFTTDFQKQIEDMLSNLNMVIYVLIFSAGLLAFIVLYNLNNININERQRELATLKVLGFQDMEVATYVYRENIMLTIIGAITGIFLGILLHRFVILTAEIDILMFGRNIKLFSFIISIILTFVFSTFVNFVMYYKLRKIDMVVSLKSVE